MRVITDLTQEADANSAHAVSIGAFDGVHLGHHVVVEATRRRAAELGVRSAVVTFDPHPAWVVRPDSAPQILVDLDQKLDLLEARQVDTVVVVPFDPERASESPEQFVESVLVRCLGTKAIIVGEDFHFGKDRTGDVAALSALGTLHGFSVEGLELVVHDTATKLGSAVISSTAIRLALAEGDVAAAATMLGRYHEIRGPIVSGDQRGRTIGFPTANLAVPTLRALPADGVYAGWYLRPNGQRFPAAVNVGKRPTFFPEGSQAAHSVVEPHLIGFEGDLYGEPARLQFVARLRDERRFDGVAALKEQLALDVAAAVKILGT